MKRPPFIPTSASRRGFTLSELIVAVVAVVLITLGIASVFQSTSETISIGRSRAELDTLASAIERVMRDDLANVNKDGFFVIRNRRLTLPDGERRRADEMAFFVNGNFTTAQFSADSDHGGTGLVGSNVQSRVARVYYGHGVKLGRNSQIEWQRGDGAYNLPLLQQALEDNALGMQGGLNSDPASWALMRQPLVLTYAGKNDRQYVENPFKSFEVGTGTGTRVPLASGLVDIAATDMGKITTYVKTNSADYSNLQPTMLQSSDGSDLPMIRRMAEILPHDDESSTPWRSAGVSYRTEVAPAGLNRSEIMLTRSTLAVGVSSFAVEWSYNGLEWFGLNTNIGNTDGAPYPYRLFDRDGRPIESGITVPLAYIVQPNPTSGGGGTDTYAHPGDSSMTLEERVFGFGLHSIGYLVYPDGWRAKALGGIGGGVFVRNTELPNPTHGFDPAFFDAGEEGGQFGDPNSDLWNANTNPDWELPDRMPIPMPMLVRVTVTLSDARGEFTDVPYTFTFELPQPARLRHTGRGAQDGFTEAFSGGAP